MIVYAVISRGATVLVESTTPAVEGNFPQVTQMVIERLHSMQLPDGTRRTFVQRNNDEENQDIFFLATDIFNTWCSGEVNDVSSQASENYFHLAKEDGVIYMSLQDEPGTAAANYSFLDDVRHEFIRKYSRSKILEANAFGMEKSFSTTLSKFVHTYNTDPRERESDNPTRNLNAKVEDLKTIMGTNLSLMLKRGENIDQLMEITEKLDEEAQVFAKRSKTLKKVTKAKSDRHTYMLIAGCVFGIYLLSITVCGFTYSKCRAEEE